MHDIHHRLIMSAPAEEVFAAVAREVVGVSEKIGFADSSGERTASPIVLSRIAYDPDAHVVWRVVDGPVDWIGTEIVLAINTSPDGTVVRLTHRNWRDTDVMATHTTRWARVLLGLKKQVEMPDPTDTYA
jgi:hypothetical protein